MAYSIDYFPGREITINTIPHLYFGGTSYLGLQTDSHFQELLIKNIKKYGTNYGASRESNVQISIFREVEEYLAALVGSQKCITLSSGFLAGQLVAQTLDSTSYELFYTPNTHAAVNVSRKRQFISYKDLNSAVRNHLQNYKSTPVVFLDSMDTEGQNYPDFTNLKLLPLDQVILVVDDSHGIGIVGTKGGGVYRNLKELKPKEVIVCCSLGKGFAIQAGAIFGKKHRIDEFANSELFGGASPATPAALALLIQGEEIIKKKRALLQQHILFFTNQVKNISQFTFVPNHPAYGFSNMKLAAHLEKHNIIITNFNYPTKNDAMMSRIILSASHTKSDITFLVEVINNM